MDSSPSLSPRLVARSERLSSKGGSVAEGGAVAARVRAADPGARGRIDGDAVRVARPLLPRGPPMHEMAAALEFGEGGRGEARLHVEEITGVTEGEAAGEPARRRHRLLHVEAVIDHRGVGLQVDLGLAVRPHAAEDLPERIVPEGERGDQGVEGNLPGLEPVRMGGIEREVCASVWSTTPVRPATTPAPYSPYTLWMS